MKLLMVEDDVEFAGSVKSGLERAKYEVTTAGSAELAREALSATRYDLILLDIELPGDSGLVLLKELRGSENPVPVIIISSRSQLDDRVLGLDLGADDYLPKPFSYSELLARVRALLRRAHGGDALTLKVSDLDIDVATRRVTRGEEEIELTQREFELLAYLARGKGRDISRDELAQEVWKSSPQSAGIHNLIDVHVSKLRTKIDEGRETKLIHTVRGVGYALRG